MKITNKHLFNASARRHWWQHLCHTHRGVAKIEVEAAVARFVTFVHEHLELISLVTNVGCSKKVGFSPCEIAPLFADLASCPNVYLPKEFRDIIKT